MALFSLLLERKEGRERRIERQISVRETGNQTRNPGMCPDWESNQQPLVLRDDAQPTEPHRSGLPVEF